MNAGLPQFVTVCSIHKLNPCQSGIVLYLSRYQFERNPWLIEQSILLLDLMLKFSEHRLPCYWRLLPKLGQPVFLAPRPKVFSLDAIIVMTFCALNGLANRLMVPISLICNSPTREDLNRARELLLNLY